MSDRFKGLLDAREVDFDDMCPIEGNPILKGSIDKSLVNFYFNSLDMFKRSYIRE